MSRLPVAVGLGLALLPTAAHAQYMDPGATSLVVQLVIAGVAGLAAMLRLYWRKLTGHFHEGSPR